MSCTIDPEEVYIQILKEHSIISSAICNAQNTVDALHKRREFKELELKKAYDEVIASRKVKRENNYEV